MARSILTRGSEADVAAKVVTYLKDCGHDVYQEVTLKTGGVCDIVAVAGPEVWIVEVKVIWSLELLQQLLDRRVHAHRVFAAVPICKGWSDRAFIAHQLGFGTFEVSSRVSESGVTEEWREPVRLVGRMPPRLTSRPVPLRSLLHEGHKTHAKAGIVGGGRYTPFRRTCEALAREVAASPGISMAEALKRMNESHYSSPATARSSLLHWVQCGKVMGVRAVRDGSRINLYPSEAS